MRRRHRHRAGTLRAARRAASTGSTATTTTSTRSPPAICRTDLHHIANGTVDRGRAGRAALAGLGGTFAPTLVRDARPPTLPHPEEGHGPKATGAGRQAAALRPRRGRGVQGAARRRRLPDPRGGEAVPARSQAAEGRTPARRRSTRSSRRCSRACTCSGTIIGSRTRSARASGRSGSTWSSRSYLLIDTGSLDIRIVPIR